MFYQNTQTARKPPSACTLPPAATEWSGLLLDDVTCSVRRTVHALHALSMRMAQQFFRFCPWWPWPVTFDLIIQTRPCEGPNTFSLWIWGKYVQQFPRYFIHNQKKTKLKITYSAKNRTSLACGKNALEYCLKPMNSQKRCKYKPKLVLF